MTDVQRTILFWVLIVLAPLTFLYTAATGGPFFPAAIAAVVCLVAACYVRWA